MTKRIHYLDGLRGIAALAVVLHHCFVAFDFSLYSGDRRDGLNDVGAFLSSFPFQPAGWGNAAVCIFFVLSGYVLASSYASRKLFITGVAAQRYVRLTIPSVVGCLIGWLAASGPWNALDQYLLVNPNEHLALYRVAFPSLSGALQQGLTATWALPGPGSNYDTVLWTMSIEFMGSLILAFIILVIPARYRIKFLYISLFLFLASYMSLFIVGALLNHHHKYLTQLMSTMSEGAKTVLAVVAVAIATAPNGIGVLNSIYYTVFRVHFKVGLGWGLHPLGPSGFVHGIGACLLFLYVLSSRRAETFLDLSPIRWLGRISFPLYLVHAPLLPSIYSLVFVSLASIDFGLAFCVASLVLLAVALCIAQIVEVAVERPTVRLARLIGNVIGGRRPRHAIPSALTTNERSGPTQA